MPGGASLDAARAQMAHCRLCEHRCGVDRTRGPAGVCGAGDRPRFFRAAMSAADELDLVPCWEISLSGCDLACRFCITGPSSQNAAAGRRWDPGEAAREALASGARSIMLLGGEPTVHLPAALELATALAGRARTVLKTNLYVTPEALALVDGAFDLVLADVKFGTDACARRCAGVESYVGVVRRNLGLVRASALRVRHLVMPGHLECCTRPVIRWAAERLCGVEFSLRNGYLPAFRARELPELARPLRREEYAMAAGWAREAGLRLVA